MYNPWIVGIGAAIIGGLILYYFFGIGKEKRRKDDLRTRPVELKTSSKTIRNIVSQLIKKLPSNNKINRLYKLIAYQGKKWSSDAKIIGSHVYLNFYQNNCTYEIIGVIWSEVRCEQAFISNSGRINKIREFTNNASFNLSPKLTQITNWQNAVVKILESCASDIEKLESCRIGINPGNKKFGTSISIFFQIFPREWSRHFELKGDTLYEGKRLFQNLTS